MSGKSGNSPKKQSKTPNRRSHSRSSSRESPQKTVPHKSSIKIGKSSSRSGRQHAQSTVSLINTNRLSSSQVGETASAKKIMLEDGAGSGTKSRPKLRSTSSKQYFDRDLTFTPQINKKSKELDRQRLGNEGLVGNTNEIDRINLLHLRGKEYSQKRELALLAKQLEPTEDDLHCSFKPKINDKYQSRLTTDLRLEDRSEAWRKRRDQRVEDQRKEKRAEQDRMEHELLVPIKKNSTPYKSRKSAQKPAGGTRGFGSPGRAGSLTEDEYVDIRLNSMRKSLEKQIANYGSTTAIGQLS